MTTTTSRSEYFKAYRERNRAKRAAWMREWRRGRDAQKAEREPVEAPKIPAPAPDGPKCKTCGKVLHHYDYQRGECFRHPVERVREARSAVRLTETKHIERNKRNHRIKKVWG